MAEHPQVVDVEHPLVQRLREYCLSFPEVVEIQSWGRPTFRVSKRIFVTIGATMDRPHSIIIKPDPDDRRAYLQDPRFFVPPYWGPSGWLAIDFDEPATDLAEIGELIDASYRQLALVRQVKVLDSRPMAPLV